MSRLMIWLSCVILICLTGGVRAAGSGTSGMPDKEEAMELPQSDQPLAERFLDPPASSRILMIIHGWPDDQGKQDAMIKGLASRSFGGVVCNVSFDGYVEDEGKWKAFLRAVGRAKEAGMAMWLYDERGYPSGTAGDIVLRGHPEWEARGLLIADAVSDGGHVELDAPPGRLVLAKAFPMIADSIEMGKAVDLSSEVRGGKLSWEAPSGRWKVMIVTEDRLYEGTHAALSLANKERYINLLMPEPTARFIEVTHGQYTARLGDLGRYFEATFTDEPSLMSMFLSPMPYRVLPWSPQLSAEFQERRGYALDPMIPALAADAGAEGRKARYDFWQTVGELVSENYFGQIQQWCGKHNIRSGGHLIHEEYLLAHVAFYGDFFQCLRRLDAPSIDCLTSMPQEVPWYIARLIGSAADLEGRSVTMSESSDFAQRYRGPSDERPINDVTEDEIRGACNRLMVSGINTITSYYSFHGLSDEQVRRVNLWIGRCCTMLRGGHQVTDIAVLYPVESIWPRFTPARHGATDSPTAGEIEHMYRAASESLYASRRDFTYIDARTLADAKVGDGVLAYRSLRWRVVILPCADTLPITAWENLWRFWETGGVVIALGALPANSETEFPSPQVGKLAREMFGAGMEARFTVNSLGGASVFLPAGSEPELPRVLDALLEPDVAVADPEAPLRAAHRRTAGHEVYFLINDSDGPWAGEVGLVVKGKGEQWDPSTGEITPLDDGDKVSLSLGPYGGMFLRFPSARLPKRLSVKSGPVSVVAPRSMP